MSETLDRKKRVIQALNAWKRREFTYGDADCCQFVSYVVNHLSGKDYAKDFEYYSEKDALKLINEFGGLKGLITNILGQPSENLDDGDPVINNFPVSGETMGIKLGEFVICLTEKGMIKLPNKHQVCGWSICLQ